MKKIVKDVLGFVSLVLVLPFIIPSGLMVLAGLYIAQLLIKIAGTGGESDKSAEGQRLENDKWSGVERSRILLMLAARIWCKFFYF